ncbi:protoporphyrin/coproporphyrin ferrochelatase [Thermoflexales bacterium]|nr:protoporphyrin/coproporphyrin ferrochelatase [Thermoflexales bacterium]
MIGVLVMAYGGPNNLDEVEPYLLDVRGHRPTAPEIVREVRERYQLIGGRSPILEQTQAQADALQAALGSDMFKTFVGMRHWHPYIKDTLAQLRAQGIERAIGLVMAPHYSRMSIGAYYKKIEEAQSPITMGRIERWHLLPGYLEGLVDRVKDALQKFPADMRAEVPIIFSAHSLPERILSWNDPYPDELQATVAAVMERLGPQPHEFAYQSAAISNEPWLGPDVGAALDRLAKDGQPHALIAPIGFVVEHVEILYDIDIVYQQQASKLGLHLERIEMLGSASAVMNGLAGLVRQTAQEAGWL